MNISIGKLLILAVYILYIIVGGILTFVEYRRIGRFSDTTAGWGVGAIISTSILFIYLVVKFWDTMPGE